MRTRFRFGWVLVLALVLTLAAQAAAPVVLANDLKEQLDKAQRDLEEIRRKQQETRNALANVAFQAREAEAQLRLVEGELVQANSQLAVITGQLEKTTAELQQVEAELKATQERYEQKKALLGARIRSIRENGRVDYLAVLFGAATFRDFIGRMDLLSLIVKKDRELFEGVKAEKLVLEKRQQEVSDRKTRLTNLKLQAESYRNTVSLKRSEREQVTRSLQESRRTLELRLNEYDQHSEQLTQQVAELVRQMNRQAGRFAPIPPVRPVSITDAYGMRNHPILGGRRMHWGTDFSAYTGQPVYAIEDGVVVVARWDNVFGYLVIIDHGGGITSWYAHSSKLLVSVNDTVTQGQQIAEAGSTGWSTGPHVHLEIHVDGEKKDPMSFIKL
ncbi:MAG: murein hydrolase activator EnvC family protein [Bacillota bacterium]